MATVTGQVTPSLNFTQTPAAGFLAGVQVPANKTIQAIFKTAGVIADQVDTLYANTLTFVASTPQTIDLTTLTDILGNAITFARVRLIAIRVNSTTDGQNLLVGGAGANEWDGFLTSGAKITVFPSTAASGGGLNNSGFFILAAPNTTGAVVNSGSKLLKLDPGSNAFTVDILIAGCSV